MIINKQHLETYDTRYRAQLINSLSGFKSANLIGTINEAGQTNLSIVSSVFHIGATPPLVGMIFRPHSVPRHTLENIFEMKTYTINQVSSQIYRGAHQTSARYDRAISEFAAAGLTEEYHDPIPAPFVKESRLKYSLDLREHQILSINDTELVIGEITNIIIDDDAIKQDGYVDIESLATIAVSGLDSYHVTKRISRLSYAKPDKAIENLDIDGHPK
ncbi:flavin oxidoreductase [Aliikangiella marina]|uniref:Flavin oxidoreductase n=1 Tax=Aliikangiella marina TaxID=1712262 RepID=A0A545TCJ0_9GAMM|nr:flavin reductase [Aliikangiella marina]TQV74934.1 flavin oxidoreductase [Aliikangiella marina]